MIFDGKKEKEETAKGFLDAAGWKRLCIVMGECLLFAVCMNLIGFWITSMAGLFTFIMTLKSGKKINIVFAILFCIVLGSVCYFGFTQGFHIPLPKGTVWDAIGISMI